ncbi:hypothetical protein C7447_101672 [Tenacibaculum adriaticum]|uniref:DUF2202 domain-containing protein n=1 Tax=Tenacibaculum adriaticum TaxID=413713 RepID=A0A5S5DVW8_9FLAO|nr:DUF2202 domain-containing protein [Tenacibaculum adriaticum]TYQ00064.1 hypothetical protein C7447_101672 [Tenacibaculum adriaticum]
MKSIIKNSLLIFLLAVSYISFSQDKSMSEIEDMKYMVEEEKMARDVYEYLGDKWNLRVFNNIKQSEQRHMEMMQNLLEVNKIDYTISKEKGVFFNKELQKIYDALITRGSTSVLEAIEVGKLIEKKDIEDLEGAIRNSQDDFAKQVYSYLLKGSQNHLRAFNRQLSRY